MGTETRREIDPDGECAICMEPKVDKVVLPCHLSCCKGCITEYYNRTRTNNEGPRCAHCRTTIPSDLGLLDERISPNLDPNIYDPLEVEFGVLGDEETIIIDVVGPLPGEAYSRVRRINIRERERQPQRAGGIRLG